MADYLIDNQGLDDVRRKVARVNTRGKLKWIKLDKIKPLSLRRQIMAEMMVRPIKRRVDYNGLFSRIFSIEPLDNE